MKLWSAQTVSQFGDEVTQLAIPFVAVLTLEVSPFQLGLLGVFQFLPFILLTIPAGVWVDRLRRRPILIGADIGRAILLASIPIAFLAGWLTIWQLYVVAFAVGCLEVFFDVAYQSYLPSVVERDRLVEGNAKLELSASASTIVGPGVAGFLVELMRAPIAIFADVISYFGSAVILLFIRRPETPPAAHDPATGPRPSMRQEAAEGLRYVLGHPYLRNIAACTGTANLFNNLGTAILLLYAIDELGLTAGTIGLIFAVANVGVLVGALTAERWGRWIGVGPTIVGSAFLSSLSAPRRGARAAGGAGAVDHRRLLHRLRDGRHLQRHPGQPAPGDHARAHAGPHERHDALHRVGHDPDRRAAGRDPGWRDRPARHDLGGSRSAASSHSCRSSSRACARSSAFPSRPNETLQAPMRCSALAEDLDEPMIGTVDQRVRWLLVEDRSAWGRDAVSDVLGADASRAAKALGLRLLLVRRREGDPAADAVRRAILVDTTTARDGDSLGHGPRRAVHRGGGSRARWPSSARRWPTRSCSSAQRQARRLLRAPRSRAAGGPGRRSRRADLGVHAPRRPSVRREPRLPAGRDRLRPRFARRRPAPGGCLSRRPARSRAAARAIRLAGAGPGRRAGASAAARSRRP